eukprot:scpid1682/ scgid5784/ Rho guanine nucleotide exchange factor 17
MLTSDEPKEHLDRNGKEVNEAQEITNFSVHFRSLDDILDFGRGDGEDRVHLFAGRLARDILATSTVFAEHKPLRITDSVTSWMSSTSSRSASVSCVHNRQQTETQRESVTGRGYPPVDSPSLLLEKRRDVSRSIPALLTVTVPSLSLLTSSSSAHADLQTAQTHSPSQSQSRQGPPGQEQEEQHLLLSEAGSRPTDSSGTDCVTAAAGSTQDGGEFQRTMLLHGSVAEHRRVSESTSITAGAHVTAKVNGGIPVNVSVTSRYVGLPQNRTPNAISTVQHWQQPSETAAENGTSAASAQECEDVSTSELPKVNTRTSSLPNHQRLKAVPSPPRQALAIRKSSSLRETRAAPRDRRWSCASGDFAPASSSFAIDHRVALGARYASEKSLQAAEVSPTPFQLLQSQMSAEGLFSSRTEAMSQKQAQHHHHYRGRSSLNLARGMTTADNSTSNNSNTARAAGRKAGARGSKKRNALSRFWHRLFRHGSSGSTLREPATERKSVTSRSSAGEWEESSGRKIFPSMRTHPNGEKRGSHHTGQRTTQHHMGVHRTLSPIRSITLPAVTANQRNVVSIQNSIVSGCKESSSTSPSSAEQGEILAESSAAALPKHDSAHNNVSKKHSGLAPHPVELKRQGSVRISLRRGMDRLRNRLGSRKRPKPRTGTRSGGHTHERNPTSSNGLEQPGKQAGAEERRPRAENSLAAGGGDDGNDMVYVMSDDDQYTPGDIVSIGGYSGSSQSLDDIVVTSDNSEARPPFQIQSNCTKHHIGNLRNDSESPQGTVSPGQSGEPPWKALAACDNRKSKHPNAPEVRINPPGDGEDHNNTPAVPAPVVTKRHLPPGKRPLRAERSKSMEGTTFDVAQHMDFLAIRGKGIPISPSWSASLERGYTLGPGDGFSYSDGRQMLAASSVRRASSQRLSIPGFHTNAVSNSLLAPESHSPSRSLSNLLSIVGVRKNSTQINSDAAAAAGKHSLVPPGVNGGRQYMSSETLSFSSGSKDGEYGGGRVVVDPSQIDSGICTSVPRTILEPPTKSKHELTNEDYRQHVVWTLLETEHSYLTSLQTLCKDYFNPLRRMNNIDQQMVADIFGDIPLIMLHHNQLYFDLKNRADSWTKEDAEARTIGDIITSAFSFGQLAEAYSSYVINYEHSQETLRNAATCRPLIKFIESRNKENEGKQTLSDLLVKPVQRIPRYGLLIKDLQHYTPPDHPDHGLLLSAFAEVEALADKLDRGVKHADQLDDMRKIELCFQGALPGLMSADRYLVRRDRISEQVAKSGYKERWLFLFNDCIVCATMRRRTGNRKPMAMSMSSGTLTDPDVVRYKLMWRAPLQDVCVIQSQKDKMLETQSNEILQRLQDDLNALSQMNSLCNSLSIARPASTAVNNLQLSIGAVLKEINMVIDEQKHDRDVATLHIAIESKSSGLIDHKMAFATVKDKTDWIVAFSENKETVVASLGGASAWCTPDDLDENSAQPVMPLPAFSAAMPVLKTRSGMQITCSSPSVGARRLTPYAVDAKANGQLWICTSDRDVGQICMVSMEKSSPMLSACIAVPDGKITSIMAVPEYVPPSVSDSLARIQRAAERDSSAVASDSEFEVVSDAGTDALADDETSLKQSLDLSSPRHGPQQPEKRLSTEQLAFLRTKLSTALLLSYRNRLRLPSMVMEEREDSDWEKLSSFGERSRALSVLSNVSLRAFSDDPLGNDELESLYSSASLLRVLSVTPGLLGDDAPSEKGDTNHGESDDGFKMSIAPVKRLLAQSLSDGVLLDFGNRMSAGEHAPLSRTKSNIPSTSDLHKVPEMKELLKHLQAQQGSSTPLQAQLSHASLLSTASDLLEAPPKEDGSNEWLQPEPAGPECAGDELAEVKPLLQRKSLSDDEEADTVAVPCGNRRLRPDGSTSDRDEPLELPSAKGTARVPIAVKRLKPLTRRLSAPAESPTRLSLKNVKSPEDVFEAHGGKRLTSAVQNLLKPSRKVRKPPLRATKSGSASSTDLENSPAHYLARASRPVKTEGLPSSVTNSGVTLNDRGDSQSVSPAIILSREADVQRSGSTASRHSIGVMQRRPAESLQLASRRARKHRSRSLPQVIISSHTNLSSGAGSNASSSDAEGDGNSDHNPTMWLSMSQGLLCIYRAGDSSQMRQRKTVLKLSSNVKCMCYMDGCVFVSLEGGQLLQFCRGLNGNWDTSSAELIDVGEPEEVVTCMTVVDRHLWCGVGKCVHVIHPLEREVEAWFSVTKSPDTAAQITDMVCNENAVYVATSTSPVVTVYHATSHRLLAEVNIQPCVQYLLQGCNSIIKQHKTRCLRITVMHSYRSTVWIGTSAGIVLLVPALHADKDDSTTNGDEVIQLRCHGSFHGHTGPVRFITTVERPATASSSQANGGNGVGSNSQGSEACAEVPAPSASAAAPPGLPPPSVMSLVSNSMRSSMFLVDHDTIRRAKKPLPMVAAEAYQPLAEVEAIVVAGGDGCEDFHVSSMVENEESSFDTDGSHILMWRVD